MSHSLPPALKDSKLPVAAQLEALAHWLQTETDAQPVDAYLETFLEVQLRSGQPRKAHEAACKAASGVVPILPRGLGGADDLSVEPYAFRDAIEIALRVAGLHAKTRRSLLRPLFRSLLLWATHEREIAMQALLMAQPTDEELAQHLPPFLDELPRVKERPGERVLIVIEVGFTEPRWLIALCRALSTRRTGIDALMKLEFAILPAPADLYPAPWTAPEPLAALRALLQTPGPLTRALVTLCLAAAPDGVSDAALIELLDDARLPAWLREETAGWLIFRNVRATGAGIIADRLLSGQVRYSFGEKLQRLRQNATPRPARTPLRNDDICYVPLESRIASGPAALDGEAIFLLVRTLQRFPAGDWRCAEEEAALGVMSARGEFRELPLPLKLPTHRTGAAGAEREWALACVLDGKLVISLRVPFSDERGWGTENYLLAFGSQSGWHALERTPDGFTMHPLPVAIPESELPSWGHGELLAWKDAQGTLKTYNDCTPYHLDGVDPSDEAVHMTRLAERAERGWTQLQQQASAKKNSELLISGRGARKSIRLRALEDALRQMKTETAPMIAGGVALGNGALAVGLRAFDETPSGLSLDAVALIHKP